MRMDWAMARVICCSLMMSVVMVSCRSSSSGSSLDLLTVETSRALDEACRREIATAEIDELNDAEGSLGRCLGALSAVQMWSKQISERIQSNWPKDYLAKGPDSSQCLKRLTQGAVVRYLNDLAEACEQGAETRRKEIAAVIAQSHAGPCYDMVHMTVDGCFAVNGCNGSPLELSAFGDNSGASPNEAILCADKIQKIHGIKDPGLGNLLYNYSYVSEMTGNQSSNRITYGPPNCHGTAQAAAGGVLDDLKLDSMQHARLSNQSKCDAAVSRFFSQYKSTPISQIPMDPGGVMINMKYDSCGPDDCGQVNLWIDDCHTDKLDLSVFIDGMCIDCWEKKLALAGLKRQSDYFSGKQLIPGCILTTKDHSVMIIGQSHGMCFFYEATTPYGPPQVRAVPCAVINHKFSRQYCPEISSIRWRIK